MEKEQVEITVKGLEGLRTMIDELPEKSCFIYQNQGGDGLCRRRRKMKLKSPGRSLRWH